MLLPSTTTTVLIGRLVFVPFYGHYHTVSYICTLVLKGVCSDGILLNLLWVSWLTIGKIVCVSLMTGVWRRVVLNDH